MAENRRKPLFNMISFLMVLVIIVVIVVVSGYFFSRQCFDMLGKSFCWSTVPRTITSDLCPAETNGTCTIEPAVDQHNTLVDAIIYACTQSANNTDPSINQKISDVYSQMTNITQTADQICSGSFLSKWSYS